MNDPSPTPLADWMAYLNISDCTCDFAWKSLGRLYAVSMGKGWVRMTTDPNCPHHGTNAPDRKKPGAHRKKGK